jgi:hypothetical protein
MILVRSERGVDISRACEPCKDATGPFEEDQF